MEATTQQLVRIGAEDRNLHGLFLDFVDRAFPDVDFRAEHVLGGWTDTYVAYSVLERGVMVANASVTQMSLCVAGETQRAAQLGAVAVLPTHRGRGLARRVVAAALEAARLSGDAAFLFEVDAIVVARSEGNVLWIFDILSPALFALSEVLPRLITSPVSELKFGFTPDRWWPAAHVVSPYTDSPLFVSQGLRLGSEPFKYPLLAQT